MHENACGGSVPWCSAAVNGRIAINGIDGHAQPNIYTRRRVIATAARTQFSSVVGVTPSIDAVEASSSATSSTAPESRARTSGDISSPATLSSTGVVASVRCDALMLDDESRSDTYPYIDIQEDDTTMTHEATVGKVSADQIFYLMSRGLTENEATNLIVQGFLEVFTKELPMEYALEFKRLIRLEMEGALG